jgi:hypothetical protein
VWLVEKVPVGNGQPSGTGKMRPSENPPPKSQLTNAIALASPPAGYPFFTALQSSNLEEN